MAQSLILSIFWLCLLLFPRNVLAQAHHKFLAGAKHPSLKRATTSLEPSYDFQKLLYAKEAWGADPEMAASIVLEPKYPLVIHEDLEAYIRSIRCSGSKLSVFFWTAEYLQMAEKTWTNQTEFVLVTNDPSCAEAGEHAAWRVNFESLNYRTSHLLLNGTRSTLKDVTHRMFFDIGEHVMPQLERHELKRQVATQTVVVVVTEVTVTTDGFASSTPDVDTTSTADSEETVVTVVTVPAQVDTTSSYQEATTETTETAETTSTYQVDTTSTYQSDTTSYEGGTSSSYETGDTTSAYVTPGPTQAGVYTRSFSYASPTASPTGTDASSDVGFSEAGLVLLPPDQAIVDSGFYPQEIANVQLTCLNCSGTGQVSFNSAGFTVGDESYEQLYDFFEDGYIEFDATDLSAYISLELELQPGFSVTLFDANLPRRRLGTIEVANVIVLESFLDLSVPISIALTSPVTIQAGFTYQAMQPGKVILNMNDITASNTSGFDQATLNALPFNLNAPDLSFSMSVSWRPRLSINAGITSESKNDTEQDYSIQGGLGVFLDVPKLSATFSELHNVDNNCQPLDGSSNTYVGIAPGIQWDAGVDAHLDAKGIPNFALPHLKTTLFSYSTALPTQCLLWDQDASGFVNPSATSSLASASGSAALSASLASVSASEALQSASAALSSANAASTDNLASYSQEVASASSAVNSVSSASASAANSNGGAAAVVPVERVSWWLIVLFGIVMSLI